jgi:hypothetical protein
VRGVVDTAEGALKLTFSAGDGGVARVVGVHIRRFVPGLIRLEGTRLRWSGPEDKDARAVCDLLNAGKIAEARQRIDTIASSDHPYHKACLLEALAGSMQSTNPADCLGTIEEALAALEKVRDGVDAMALAERRDVLEAMRTALRYVRMMRYTRSYEATSKSGYRRFREAIALAEWVEPDEPLYWQAQLLRARVLYWLGREGSRPSAQRARPIIKRLFEHFPNNRIVRIYAHQPVRPSKDYAPTLKGAPMWATRVRALLASVLDVVRFWITERQIETGEIGGGWGDDVEILRRWGSVALAVDVPLLNTGIARIADGVWAHNPDLRDHGYPAGLSDVEHAAEPVSDTQPLSLALNYGQPRFVQRCLLATSHMPHLWTGLTPKGHRHFKTYRYGWDQVDANPNHGYDVPLNARATKPGLWAAWYSGEPELVRLLSEWGKAWVADARRTDSGKPAGVFPAGVRFADDTFPDPWHITPAYTMSQTGSYDYLLYEHLLGMWLLTKDEDFCEPMHAMMRLVLEQHRRRADGPTGSAAWVGTLFGGKDVRDNSFLAVVRKWRQITGDKRYDAFLAQAGPACVRYWLGGATDKAVLRTVRSAIRANARNFEMLTSEVLFTDRVSLAGFGELYAMYGGGVGDLSGCPGWAVRWIGAGQDLAAWVQEATQERFRARVYSFAVADKSCAMQHWRLAPGQYQLVLRLDKAEADPLSSNRITLHHRGDEVPLTLPPHQPLVVELEQITASSWDPARLPDLAASRAPTSASDEQVCWPIYNLGSLPAENVPVQLLEAGRCVEVHTVAELPPTKDFKVGRVDVTFQHRHAGKPLSIVIDPDDRIPEITEHNNRVVARSVRR